MPSNLKPYSGVDDKAHVSEGGHSNMRVADPLKCYKGPESHKAGKAKPGGRKMRSRSAGSSKAY